MTARTVVASGTGSKPKRVSVRRFSGLDLWERAFGVLLIIAFGVICFTFQDYGVSWDDEYSRLQGADYLRWFASGFSDRSVLSGAASEYLYGAAFHAPAAALAFFSPLRPYETIHLVIALAGLFGLFVVFRIAHRLAGSMAAFFAAAILILTPTYYGHWFINPKDLPFAVAYIGAILMLLKVYDSLPKPSIRLTIATGVVIGCALGIRLGGVILLGYTIGVMLVWHVAHHLTNSRIAGSRPPVTRTLGAALGITVIAWAVLVLWWPFAQLDPINNPLHALSKTTSFDGAGFLNLYRGSWIRSDLLPREYLPYLLSQTLPEFYVAGMGLAFFALLGWVFDYRRAGQTDWVNAGRFFVVAAVAAAPIVAAVVLRPTVYDSTRLFLFVVPPLAIIAGIGFSHLFTWIPSRMLRWAAALPAIALAALVFADMIRLHPYQYVYFNKASGGLERASELFDTEYWGTSHKEGIEWLSRNYKPDAPRRSIGVANPSNAFLTAYYLTSGKASVDRFTHSDIREKPDVILAQTRWNLHLIYGGRVLHIVQRLNVPFLYVIESTSTGVAEDSIMKVAATKLYARRDPAGALSDLESVLRVNSSHYGALISLATAQQRLGNEIEARAAWTKVQTLATLYGDRRVVGMATAALGQ